MFDPKDMRKGSSRYDATVAEKLCLRIAAGATLLRVCSEPGMPSTYTVYKWRRIDPAFREKLARVQLSEAHKRAAGS
jgi:hypothetical protein